MNQYQHLVSTSGIALPTDIWYPTTDKIRPQRSDQIAFGAEYLLNEKYLITNEYYYKWIDRKVNFVDGAQLFANDNLEGEFAIGDGYGYGMELGIEKQQGKLKGWIGYTLALVRIGNFEPVGELRQFSTEGYFSPRFDRRHDFSLVAMYDLNRRITISGTAVYGSGDRAWLPEGRFTFQDAYGGNVETVTPIYGDRNNIRLPYYLRSDLGIVYRFFPKWGESDLTFSVYNLTNRRNTFFIYFEPEFEQGLNENGDLVEVPTRVAAKQVSLFPILGSVTWNFKF